MWTVESIDDGLVGYTGEMLLPVSFLFFSILVGSLSILKIMGKNENVRMLVWIDESVESHLKLR